MRALLAHCLAAPGCARQRVTLERLLDVPLAHARFLNTLARLEYIGVRKMLKARRADQLNLEGMQHMLEEAVHATRLKKLAVSLAPAPEMVATFSAAHTLAGDAAERYFQQIDKAASDLLGDAPDGACYWVTSTAIEIRAMAFYPTYQALLTARSHKISLNAIIQDEEEHLVAMTRSLPAHVPNWQALLTRVMAVEEVGFCTFLDAVDAELTDTLNRN
jgi:hypothetical protein